MIWGIASNCEAIPLLWPGTGLIGQQTGEGHREKPWLLQPACAATAAPLPRLHSPPADLASGPGLGEAEASSCSHMWEGYEKKNPGWPKHLNKNYTRIFCFRLDMVRINLEVQKMIIFFVVVFVFESELLDVRIQSETQNKNTWLKSVKWYRNIPRSFFRAPFC